MFLHSEIQLFIFFLPIVFLFLFISHFCSYYSTQLPAIFKSGNVSENKIIQTNSFSKGDDEIEFPVRTSKSVSELQLGELMMAKPSSSAQQPEVQSSVQQPVVLSSAQQPEVLSSAQQPEVQSSVQQPVVLSSSLLPNTPLPLSSSSSSSLSLTPYITIPTSISALPTPLPTPPLPLPLSLSLGSPRVRSKGRGSSERPKDGDTEIISSNFLKNLDRAHLRGSDAAKNFLEEYSLLLHRYENIINYFLRGF